MMVLPDRKSFSVDNNAAGYSELVKRLRGLSIAAIGIEPSGGYERAVIRALLAAGFRIKSERIDQVCVYTGSILKGSKPADINSSEIWSKQPDVCFWHKADIRTPPVRPSVRVVLAAAPSS